MGAGRVRLSLAEWPGLNPIECTLPGHVDLAGRILQQCKLGKGALQAIPLIRYGIRRPDSTELQAIAASRRRARRRSRFRLRGADQGRDAVGRRLGGWRWLNGD